MGSRDETDYWSRSWYEEYHHTPRLNPLVDDLLPPDWQYTKTYKNGVAWRTISCETQIKFHSIFFPIRVKVASEQQWIAMKTCLLMKPSDSIEDETNHHFLMKWNQLGNICRNLRRSYINLKYLFVCKTKSFFGPLISKLNRFYAQCNIDTRELLVNKPRNCRNCTAPMILKFLTSRKSAEVYARK